MAILTARESALIARCSRSAIDHLAELRKQAIYPLVLSRLERVPGNLFSIHIERAIVDVMTAKRLTLEESTAKAAATTKPKEKRSPAA